MALKKMNLDDIPGDHGKVLLLGQQGSGKTSLAGSVAELGKTLFCYFKGDEGINSLRGESWSKNLDVVRIEDPTEIREVFHDLKGSDEYVAAVFDGITSLQDMWIKHILGLPMDDIRQTEEMGEFMEMKDWGTLKDITTDVMVNLYSLASHAEQHPKHIIMTSQVREYEEEEDKISRVGSAVSSGCRVPVHSAPDYILHCVIEEDPESEELDAPEVHRVMLLPDDRRKVKLHTSMERAKKTPRIVGNENTRLTMKKFFKMMEVPT